MNLASTDYGSFRKTTFGRLAFAGPHLAALVTRSAPPFEELDVRFSDLSGTLAPFGAWLGESTAAFRAQLLGFTSARPAGSPGCSGPVGSTAGATVCGRSGASPITPRRSTATPVVFASH